MQNKPQELLPETLKLITDYYTGNTKSFDGKDETFQNLLLFYVSDNNSSTLRELATLSLVGYESNPSKHGHDGVARTSNRLKEVNPRFIIEGEKAGVSGNFNDMTLLLLNSKRYMDVVCSLFCGNRLIYIVEFPLEIIYEHLKQPIDNAKLGRRVVCSFGWKQYDHPSLRIHYFDSISAIEKGCLSKPHYNMLMSRSIKC